MEGGGHLPIQPFVHGFLIPVIAVGVLDLLEVGDGDAPGVAQEVRDHVHAPLVQDHVGFRGGGAIGELGQDLGLDPVGVLLGDLILQGRRDEHGHIEFQELFVGDVFGTGEALDRPGLALVFHQCAPVQALGAIDPSLGVGHGHHLEAQDLHGELMGELAGIPIALDGASCPGEVKAQYLGRLPDGIDPASGGGITSAGRSTERQRLSGDHTWGTPSHDLLVLVQHPGHDLGVGIDVGRGNIDVRADVVRDGPNVTPGKALQLPLGHLLGVANHPALPPAQGEVHDGGLPGHPGGQGTHGVERLLGVEADPTLGGTTGVVVLHPKSLEHPYRAVVHPHRDAHVKLPHRPTQKLVHCGIQSK